MPDIGFRSPHNDVIEFGQNSDSPMPLGNRHLYQFGPYHIDTAERRLLRGDQPIPLTPKAYDTLLALVENAGHGLKKDELMRRVWPDTFVEEGSLTRNISVLRKVLGDDEGQYIETLPKHGYRFAAPVQGLPSPAETVEVEEHTVARVLIEEAASAGWRLSPIRVVGAILLVMIAVALAYVATRGTRLPIHSLAVLPLKDLSGGVDRRYLELGIADSIIGRVNEISDVIVRPTGSVRKYLASGTDPLQAGRELRVDAVLDGSLQVAGNRIRVSLNLIETSKGVSLWAHAFDVPLSDIFDTEDEVARQVTRQLRLGLTGRQPPLTRRSTRSAEAYEHYLKGVYSNEARAASGGGRASIESAMSRFRKAVELDPSYAQAWAQLANCYYQLVNVYQPDPNLAEKARNAADRAYALDPDLPELLVFRAQVLWSWNGHYRIEEAIRELRRSSGYNSSEVRSLLGVLYHHAGLHRQATVELKRALEIDPANSLHLDRLAEGYVWAGRFEEARAAYERAFAFESEAKGSLAFSAIPFLYARQFEEARRRLKRARAPAAEDRVSSAYLALLAAMEGRFQEAEGAIPPDIHEMEKFRNAHHVSYAFASVFALQGKSTDAVYWLRKTVETGMPDYPMFARDPNLALIRTSTEFVQFMSELKPRYETIDREFR